MVEQPMGMSSRKAGLMKPMMAEGRSKPRAGTKATMQMEREYALGWLVRPWLFVFCFGDVESD